VKKDLDPTLQKVFLEDPNKQVSSGISLDPDIYKKRIINEGFELINKSIDPEERFIIIDIGGYFSGFYEDFIEKKLSFDRDRKFLGIVEDTENGHQKYEQVLARLKKKESKITIPVYSVARSKLKDTEDYNVGKSIVESTVIIQRTQAHTILNRMNVAGVIGFGKIGKSIAEHLRQKNLKEVIVYDCNIIRQFEASSLGFKTVSRADLIRNSEIIFSATGKKCLKKEDLHYLQDNIFIASCTSREDEFDSTFLRAISLIPEERSKVFDNIHKIIVHGKRLNLLDGGNAINFVHGAVNGPYIYSVQAALIVSAFQLIKHSEDIIRLQDKDLNTITFEEMQSIALIWQRHFDKCDTKIDIHIEKFILDFRVSKVDIERRNKFIDLVKYLQEGKYFVNQSLETIIDHIQKILSNFNENKYKLDIILCEIYENIRSYEFCYLMSYLCDFLITELGVIFGENMYENGFANIKLELSILRAWADKVTDISSQNEKSLRTTSFNDLLLIINKFSKLHERIDISERAIKYLEELIKDCQENTSNIHKPFMDIVKNIETIYTTRIRLLQKREVNVGYSSGRYNATPI
jgi:adenosylhomocysteinase